MLPDRPGPPAAPFAHPIDLRGLSWATPLARDYCHAFDRLERFYPGEPTAPSTWRDAIAARQAPRGDAARIADVLTTQLRARAAPTEAVAAAEQLGRPGTVAIVTGQQAGLFGGPLFTLLKALTAIALARQVATDHGVRVVPVFWVDAEDHDLDEVRTCSVLDAEFALRRIELDLSFAAGRPTAAVRFTETIGQALGELREALPPTEFTDELLERLGAAYAVGVGMADAFSRWLDSILGTHGLVVFDASDEAAKPLVGLVFDRELRLRGETCRLATAAGEDLSASGYHAQVIPPTDAVALFQLDGTRRPIRLRDDAFAVGDVTLSADEMLTQAREHPETFSPNVLLRPIVQDTLFPTIAYVTGPHELAYLGQLRQAYELFGVPMPLIYPRLTATIVDRASVKFLTRYEVDFKTLHAQDDGALNRLLTAQIPTSVEQAVRSAERELTAKLDAIGTAVLAVDPTLVGAVRTTRERMERDLRNLQGKIIQAAKRRDETLRRQFYRTRAQAFPNGDPQERAVAFVYFLNRYGPGMIDRLLDDLPLDVGQHWLLTV